MKKILLIEDDNPLCWLLERILDGKYEVTILGNGLDAWCWLSEGNRPDLIISDINMPSLDGIELLENLRNSGLFQDIPVIMLSGYESPEKRKQCLDLGVFTYLVKPFEPRLFLETVQQALTSSKQYAYA